MCVIPSFRYRCLCSIPKKNARREEKERIRKNVASVIGTKKRNKDWEHYNMLVCYLLKILGQPRAQHKGPRNIYLRVHGFLRAFAILTSHDLAASNQCPLDPLRGPAIIAFRSRRRRHPAFPGESASDYHVHLGKFYPSRSWEVPPFCRATET